MTEVIDRPKTAKTKIRSVQRDYDPINPNVVLYYLRDLRYPASRESIVLCANNNNAPVEIMQIVDKLAAQQYRGPLDLIRMITRLY